MNHKLIFVKISPNHEIAGVGFAGNMFIILSTLVHVLDGERLYVDMETNECVCTEGNISLHDTNNSWEYFFNQVKLTADESINVMDSLVIGNLAYTDRDMFMYPENFIALKEKFYNNFQLKPYLTTFLNDYYDKNINGKVTLGVQIRLTDMQYHHNASPVSSYINKINRILVEHPEIEQIFLATDDSVAIEQLKANVTIPVLTHENMFRADLVNTHHDPHARLHDGRELHRYNLGVECVKEIFTLSKCDYLLKADISSISIVASILAENIKKVYKV